eukprot:5032100-Prorocentrum_lima.AAC.1
MFDTACKSVPSRSRPPSSSTRTIGAQRNWRKRKRPNTRPPVMASGFAWNVVSRARSVQAADVADVAHQRL